MRHPLIALTALTTLAFNSTTVLAHDDVTLDTMKAPNGGQLRMAGNYHFELVVAKDSTDAKDNPVAVYLTDHAGNKAPLAGASSTATILSGKSKVSVPLAPAGDNKLFGTGKYSSDPQMKVVVSVTFADKKTEQARFTPLASTGSDGQGHHHH